LAHSILDLKHALEFLDILLDVLKGNNIDSGLNTHALTVFQGQKKIHKKLAGYSSHASECKVVCVRHVQKKMEVINMPFNALTFDHLYYAVTLLFPEGDRVMEVRLWSTMYFFKEKEGVYRISTLSKNMQPLTFCVVTNNKCTLRVYIRFLVQFCSTMR